VTVDAKGNYTINQQPISFRDAGWRRPARGGRAGRGGRQSPVVIVNADQFAMHQMVINVMEAARLAGYEKLTFAAQTGAANKR
jgi:biopolymer transport protein ExbD